MLIHKEGLLKMRPIVSNVGAATEKILKWLVKEFAAIGPVEGFNVKNSTKFVERMKEIKLKRTESLVSFDVEALFPSIPVTDAIGFVQDWFFFQNVLFIVSTHLFECNLQS